MPEHARTFRAWICPFEDFRKPRRQNCGHDSSPDTNGRTWRQTQLANQAIRSANFGGARTIASSRIERERPEAKATGLPRGLATPPLHQLSAREFPNSSGPSRIDLSSIPSAPRCFYQQDASRKDLVNIQLPGFVSASCNRIAFALRKNILLSPTHLTLQHLDSFCERWRASHHELSNINQVERAVVFCTYLRPKRQPVEESS
jgi:hypothetical protein